MKTGLKGDEAALIAAVVAGKSLEDLAFQEADFPFTGLIEVGLHPPNTELPPHGRGYLEDIAEVVDATGTQVLEMRERGGPEAGRFSVGARQEAGINMVAFGDVEGTRVRQLAWTPDGDGWPRDEYEHLQASMVGLPAADSDEIMRLTAGRPEAPVDDVDKTPWITFAEMAELMSR